MDLTVAGLSIPGDNDDIVQPLEAVISLKGLNKDGDVCYWSKATDGLTTVEARGMALTLLDDLRFFTNGRGS